MSQWKFWSKRGVGGEIGDLPPLKLEMSCIRLYQTLAIVTKLDEEIQELMTENDGSDIDNEILNSHKKNRDMHALLIVIDRRLGAGSK